MGFINVPFSWISVIIKLICILTFFMRMVKYESIHILCFLKRYHEEQFFLEAPTKRRQFNEINWGVGTEGKK